MTISKKNVINTIKQIAKELVDDKDENLNDEIRLKLIASESVRMMAFIAAIEEIFDIEINDELITESFFYDFNYLIKIIYCTINTCT